MIRILIAITLFCILATAQTQKPYPYLLGNTKSILQTSFCAKWICKLLYLKNEGDFVTSSAPKNKEPYQITEVYKLIKAPGIAVSLRRTYQSKNKTDGFLVNTDLYPFFDIKDANWWGKPGMKTINRLTEERFEVLKEFQFILYNNYVISNNAYTLFYWKVDFYKNCYSQIKQDTRDFSGGNSLINRISIQTGYPGDKIAYKYTGSCGYDFPDYDNYPFPKAVIFIRWSLMGP